MDMNGLEAGMSAPERENAEAGYISAIEALKANDSLDSEMKMNASQEIASAINDDKALDESTKRNLKGRLPFLPR